jgi:methyl-accepting chemotaxis protein
MIVSVSICAGMIFKYISDIESLKNTYKVEKLAEIKSVKSVIQEKFRYVYQTIRTMSLVPGVRKLDRYAKHFDPDAKMSIQQLYNNAYLNIQLSEIYLLPKSIDPDVIDPVTKKPEEPITTFDELVLSDVLKDKDEEEAKDPTAPPKLEETEIYEYRLMKKQLQYLSEHYGNRNSFKDLNVPVVSGPEVVTCDNAEFTEKELAAGNDEPRKGLVFTVPTYDYNGAFNGAVSAVIRTNIVRQLIPASSYAIVSRSNDYKVLNNPDESFKKSLTFFEAAKPNPDLIMSSIEPLEISDAQPWELWVAIDDSNFWQSHEVQKAQQLFWIGLVAVLLINAMIVYSLLKEYKLTEKMRAMVLKLSELSLKTSTISAELNRSASQMNDATSEQSVATQETAASITEISVMLKQTSGNSVSLKDLSGKANESSKIGEKLISEVSKSAVELEAFSKKTSIKMSEMQTGLNGISNFISEIGQKTNVINEIVFQTKLLSFNASVEAARAGEHGKGFAVVAEEIGNLAKMSGESANEIMKTLEKGSGEIGKLISDNSESVQEFLVENKALIETVISNAENCHSMFKQIHSQVESISKMTGEITSAAEEQSRGVEEVNSAISSISSAAVQNSNENQTVMSVILNLNEETEHLDSVVQEITKIMKIKNKSKSGVVEPLMIHDQEPAPRTVGEN